MIKLFKTDEARIDRSAPFPVDIVYTDGKIIQENYVVDYGHEIGVYGGNLADSPRKYTIYPLNEYICEIRWVQR